ncbi:glycine zipper 2TM domain-containing protein [Paraburkholderia sp. MMS20-SJTN17]|uniref:Glycine zipper 2TM domain-containing protein n=1 Tax=Paraburkholderia translucens TaxID=2886945 RepID=A0ABS8KJ87_9BURK|nr:glycine zipper 2TM domain-containing protein [Paraburkholderia sp. MMS20-SJTN17]MCC8404803.1 glycine zipper 2TM domain-containing protein [Paraburkholderia sp. MMS20-SJTN17]
MDNPTHRSTQHRLHPLIAVAAGAVLVASLVATAAITGVFPKASSNGTQNDQTQAAQVSAQQPGIVDSAAPVNPSVQQQQAQAQQAAPSASAPLPIQRQQAQAAPRYAQPPEPQAPPQYAQQPAPQAAYCPTCGTVVAISAVQHEGHGTGIGAVGGAVAGGVVGNQFGAGSGRTVMTLLGALGGGLAGNSAEKHLRSTTSYSVRVHMEDGKTRYFSYHEAPPFHDGERVRVQNGGLVAD